MYWKSGDVYQGEFKHSRMCGQGTMNFANGQKYEGQWENGKMHGQGMLQYYCGKRQITQKGRFENGVFKGG